MALRRSQFEPAEQSVRVADVLAEVAQSNPSRAFDEQAERVTATLAKKLVSRDWSGRPCIPAVDAERLLWSMRRDLAQDERERSERVHEAELEYAGRMPSGTLAFQRPGEPDWIAPGHDPRQLGRQGWTTTPGGD